MSPTRRKRLHNKRSSSRARRKRALILRDGLYCWVCGEYIDPQATGDAQLSTDHVIPLSVGGANRLTNMRLAHFGCNRDRDKEGHYGV